MFSIIALFESKIMYIKYSVLALSLIISAQIKAEAAEHHDYTQPLHYVLHHARDEFAPFLDNVLRQMSSKAFVEMIDAIEGEIQPKTDRQWYQEIMRRATKQQTLIGKYTPLYRLQALRGQRAVLSQQLRQLIAAKKNEIRSCVEIGKPGTYVASIRNFLPNLERIYVINDKQSITDRVEALNLCHLLTPYDQFIALNNYEPISAIKPQTVDLVICTIGLHHVPQEKLDAFVASIKTILRPGGLFILRDHDAHSEHLHAIVCAAHSVFNAVLAQEAIETESAEYRNFQPLQFWIDLLERHGFKVGTQRILQAGDPTLNTMIKAKSVAVNAQERELIVSRKLAAQNGYTRDLMQTYLTTPEWVNVDVAQEYGNFINHTPFYEFPWMQSVASYWKAFARAYKTAATKRGILPVIASPYTLMNLFIGITMSIEHAAKACISAPLRWMYSGAESEILQALVYDPRNELCTFDSTITIVEQYDDNLVRVTLPRYKLFLQVMKRLPETALEFKEIAGQKEIQCKVKFKNNQYQQLKETIDCFATAYTWTLPTQPHYTYAGVTVAIEKLRTFIEQLQKKHVELLYVHDF